MEPVLRCPNRRCAELVIGIVLEEGSEIALRCSRKKCRCHWWATRLYAGNIRDQMMNDYEDAQVVDQLMALYQLPASIPSAVYWQVPLTSEQFYEFNDKATGPVARSFRLFRGILSLHRRAS